MITQDEVREKLIRRMQEGQQQYIAKQIGIPKQILSNFKTGKRDLWDSSLEALNDYLKDLMITDKKIAEILEKLGIKRNVNPYDRSFYKTWTETWNFDDSMLDYATTLSVGKSSAMQYMNKILSNWKSQNITTLDKAKATNLEIKEETKSQNATISKEDINALFSNLEYVEV